MWNKILYAIVAIILLGCNSQKTTEVSWEKEEEYPLLETMAYYQRFSHKLWLAGANENWELAEFYNHELEEVTETFIQSEVLHEGQNLSALAKEMMLPAVEQMDKSIDDEGLNFVENYQALVTSCNACHAMSDHGYIRIKLPDSTHNFNQVF
jgi:hypothetical protein